MVMHELSKIDPAHQAGPLTHRLPERRTIRYHANSYKVTFYDKVKDLEKARYSEKRAMERDSSVQLDILEKLKLGKPRSKHASNSTARVTTTFELRWKA